MTTMTTKTTIEERISELESMDRVLVGSDEGTHSNARTYRIYETIQGERYAVKFFGGNNGVRCEEAEAAENTAGRIIVFSGATSELRVVQRELTRLRNDLRNA